MKTLLALEYKTAGFGLVTGGDGGDDGFVVSGYASLFGLRDSVGDVTRPGAFAGSIQARPSVPLLREHDKNQLLGHVTLMTEDQRGLLFKAVIVPTSLGADTRKLIEAGSLSGISYSYNVTRKGQTYVNGLSTRELLGVDLFELSLVLWPALDAARLSGGKVAKSVIRDAVAVAEVEDHRRRGLPVSDRMLRKAIEAEARETQRLLYDGQTEAEWMCDLLAEMAELEWELRKAARE